MKYLFIETLCFFNPAQEEGFRDPLLTSDQTDSDSSLDDPHAIIKCNSEMHYGFSDVDSELKSEFVDEGFLDPLLPDWEWPIEDLESAIGMQLEVVSALCPVGKVRSPQGDLVHTICDIDVPAGAYVMIVERVDQIGWRAIHAHAPDI